MPTAPLIYPVILCGGAGTRLWPLSRKAYPKQFAHLIDDTSLFQRAASLAAGDGFAAPAIVTGDPFHFIVVEQLDAIGKAPSAILAAALVLQQRDAQALMLVLPSDHLILDTQGFRATVSAARQSAQDCLPSSSCWPWRAMIWLRDVFSRSKG
jgi:mannose-1-phosphate guanylyltransferase